MRFAVSPSLNNNKKLLYFQLKLYKKHKYGLKWVMIKILRVKIV
jgi:hypothetical protein